MNKTKEEILSKVQKIVERGRTGFSPDYDTKKPDFSEITFSSREHGDVGAEEYGQQDVIDARKLKAEIEKELELTCKIDTVDEWVILQIIFKS